MLNSPRGISDCYRIDLANGETTGEIGIAVRTSQHMLNIEMKGPKRGHTPIQFPSGVIK